MKLFFCISFFLSPQNDRRRDTSLNWQAKSQFRSTGGAYYDHVDMQCEDEFLCSLC